MQKKQCPKNIYDQFTLVKIHKRNCKTFEQSFSVKIGKRSVIR